MTAPSRTRPAPAALQWAVAGAAASVLVGGGAAALIESAALHRVVPGPVWSEWGWWAAAGLQLAVLVVGVLTGEPGGRRFLLTAITAGAAHLAGGSLLVTARSDPGDWAQAAGTIAVYSIWIFGNAPVAVVAPLLLGLLRRFRPVTIGVPARWAPPAFTGADADAAAEDFGIF